jgi:hypothetical protein
LAPTLFELELETPATFHDDRSMITLETVPVVQDWTTGDAPPLDELASLDELAANAAEVTRAIAQVDVDAIDASTVALMAAAAGELALATGISWGVDNDDPPVALVRLIATVARRNPTAGGSHTTLLHDHLTRVRTIAAPTRRQAAPPSTL